MSLKLEVILLVVSIAFLIFILVMTRRKKLEFKYSLVWIVTSIAFIILSVCPKFLYIVSNLMGIKVPINALFLLIIFLILNIIFTLSIAVSQSLQKIKTLAQEIGIMKLEIEKLKKNKI